MTVTILKVSDDGERPELARFTFDVPLESDSLRWFNYELGVYVPWEPPAVGEEIRLPGSYMFGMGTRAAKADRPQDTHTASLTP